MTRLLLLTPFLAACVHTPVDCEWPRTCAERRDAVRAERPVAERPVDVSPPASKPVDDSNGAETGDKSREDNGGSSDDNGGKSDD